MDYQTYGEQFWEQYHKDSRVLKKYRTRDGKIVNIPTKYQHGRIDTVRERAVGNVTLADVMIARGPDTPAFLHTSPVKAYKFDALYENDPHGWCSFDDSCGPGRYFFIWHKGVNVVLSRFKGYGLIACQNDICFRTTNDGYSYIDGKGEWNNNRECWPRYNHFNEYKDRFYIYPVKNGRVNESQRLFIWLRSSINYKLLWKYLYGYVLGIDPQLGTMCYSIQKPDFWVGC